MKILITGGCGFIGTNLSLYLKKKGYRIFSLDNFQRKGSRLNYKLLKSAKIKNYNLNIFDYSKIKKLPKFDLVIDCCAEAAIEVSKKDIDRVFNTNLIGTYNILKKVKKDKSKIIFLSSSRVYSIEKLNKLVPKKILIKKIKIKKTIDENFTKLSPKSIYGFTKLASEMLIQEFAYAFNLKYIINRFGVVSGPLQFGKQDQGFISLWIWSHMMKKKLKYIGFGGYGNQIRDVLHIDDLCDLIFKQIKMFKKINNQTFNAGGGRKSYISLLELSKLCQKITGNHIKIRKMPTTSIYDIPYYLSNNVKVTQTYRWKPKKSIFDIIADTYKWLEINKLVLKKFL